MKKTALFWFNLIVLPLVMVLLLVFPYRLTALSPVSGQILPPVVQLLSAVYFTGLAASYIGYTVRFFTFRYEASIGKAVYFAVLCAGTLIIPLVIRVYSGVWVSAAFYSYFMYAAGTRFYGNELKRSVNNGFFIASLVMYNAVGAIFCSKFEDVTALFIIFPMTLMIFLWIFLQNKKNISVMMTSRNYDEKYLPDDVRKFNTSIASVIAVVITLLMLLYKLAASFLITASEGFGQAVVAFLKLFDDTASEHVLKTERAVETAAEKTSENTAVGTVSLQFLCAVFMVAVTGFLFIIIIRRGYVSRALRHITGLIRNFLSRDITGEDDDSERGYTDTIEVIDEEEPHRNSFSKMHRRWNMEYRKYQSMENGREKFRFGYGLALAWMRFSLKADRFSDTPRELASHKETETVHDFTELYYPVRYGEAEGSTEDFRVADTTLAGIKKKMAKRPK